MKKMMICHLKGDDHKTKGRAGKPLSLEISHWGGAITGAVTTMTSFYNLVLEYDDGNDN